MTYPLDIKYLSQVYLSLSGRGLFLFLASREITHGNVENAEEEKTSLSQEPFHLELLNHLIRPAQIRLD